MPDEEVINIDKAVVAELACFEGSIRTFCCGLDFVKRRFVLPFFQFEGEFIACECELRAVPHLRLVFHHPGLDLRPAALPFVEMIISAALPPVAQVELLAILKAEDNPHVEVIGKHHIPFGDVIVPIRIADDIDGAADIMTRCVGCFICG